MGLSGKKILGVVLITLLGTTLGLYAYTEKPACDTPVTIVGMGSWQGNFQMDAQGQGGLAALHSLLEKKRQRLKAERGALLLVQTGKLSGASDQERFTRRLLYPRLNLLRYMHFTGLAMSPTELEYLSKLQQQPLYHREWASVPFVSFNRRELQSKQASLIRRYQITQVNDISIWISSLSSGPEPDYASQAWSNVALEWQRQSGIDLYVLLLQNKAPRETHPQEHDVHDDDPHIKRPVKKKSPEYFDPHRMLDSLEFSEFFLKPHSNTETWPVSLPGFRQNRFAHSTLIFIAGSKANRFYRHPAGPWVCELGDLQLCEMELVFRKGRIIQMNQKYFNVNYFDQFERRVAPDAVLQTVLD